MMIRWIDSSNHRFVDSSMNRFIGPSVHRFDEPMNRWIDESMNRWIDEPINRWIDESIHRYIFSSIRWTDESNVSRKEPPFAFVETTFWPVLMHIYTLFLFCMDIWTFLEISHLALNAFGIERIWHWTHSLRLALHECSTGDVVLAKNYETFFPAFSKAKTKSPHPFRIKKTENLDSAKINSQRSLKIFRTFLC